MGYSIKEIPVETLTKLNLGCGKDIRYDYVNVDSSNLHGVDVVCDLSKFPWPLNTDSFELILASHILEHIPDTIQAMNEIWRISKDGAIVKIVVPVWGAEDAVIDPTHVKYFHPKTFDFFDHRTERYRERDYYSPAKFEIKSRVYFFKIFNRYFIIPDGFLSRLAEFLSLYFGNIIQVLAIRLEVVK